MNAQFGDAYAQSVAKDFVFDQLGGRTVERALADGVDAKVVWRAVCDTFPETGDIFRKPGLRPRPHHQPQGSYAPDQLERHDRSQ